MSNRLLATGAVTLEVDLFFSKEETSSRKQPLLIRPTPLGPFGPCDFVGMHLEAGHPGLSVQADGWLLRARGQPHPRKTKGSVVPIGGNYRNGGEVVHHIHNGYLLLEIGFIALVNAVLVNPEIAEPKPKGC